MGLALIILRNGGCIEWAVEDIGSAQFTRQVTNLACSGGLDVQHPQSCSMFHVT